MTVSARDQEAMARQLDIYSKADGPIWKHAVYDLLHGGWDLACLGGRPFLDDMARRAALGTHSRIAELGSGGGAACHYLAHHTGCSATGVDVNPSQVARARRRAVGDMADRLKFVCSDLSHVSDAESFDVTFQLDTFSLVASLRDALASAHRVTKPGGEFYMADLCAGPNFDAETERRCWELDGFSSLVSTSKMQSLLNDAGFESIHVSDCTNQAIDSNATIVEWLGNIPQPRPAGIDDSMAREWRELTMWYLEMFRDRALVYSWWGMRRP